LLRLFDFEQIKRERDPERERTWKSRYAFSGQTPRAQVIKNKKRTEEKKKRRSPRTCSSRATLNPRSPAPELVAAAAPDAVVMPGMFGRESIIFFASSSFCAAARSEDSLSFVFFFP